MFTPTWSCRPLDSGTTSTTTNSLTLSPTTPSSFTIPLQARYIQTEPTVTPGAADATVTFNINYY
ncbi:fimbrial protein [Serratia marcescens]|uniref:fimbrial protein n=1 Tax=Serratia marcescens TaxID=615 RepID=UPI003F5146B0